MPKSNIKDYIDNLSEWFLNNFDEEFSIDERSYFKNEYDLIAEVILPKLNKKQERGNKYEF